MFCLRKESFLLLFIGGGGGYEREGNIKRIDKRVQRAKREREKNKNRKE
jgi:hypothetical protein